MPPNSLLFLFVLLLAPAPSIASLRGVHPSNLSRYNSPYSCLPRDNPASTNPITLSPSQLNDDYCHCRDGSDEPGTSACPDSFFSCVNKGYRAKQIPSSWVDDLVCDCCDGSDENPGVCADACQELKAKDREHVTTRANSIWRGVKTKERYIEEGRKGRDKEARELAKLERELKSLSRRYEQSQRVAHSLRKRKELNEKLGGQADHDASGEGQRTTEEQDGEDNEYDYDHDDYEDDHEDLDDDHGDSDDLGDDHVHDDEDADDDHHLDDEQDDDYDAERDDGFDDEDEHDDDYYEDDDDYADEDDHVDEDDYEDDYEDEAEDDVGEEVEEEPRWESAGNDSDDVASPAGGEGEGDDALDLDNVCAGLVSRGPNPFIRSVTYIKLMVLSKLQKVLPKGINVLGGNVGGHNLDECVRKADQAKWDLEREKSDLERKVRDIKGKMGNDYGLDGEFWPLHGKCVRKKMGQYEFEICPFDRVKQFERGHMLATVGRYGGWGEEGRGKWMEYKNGDRCWDGPQRSIKVVLQCGEEEDIVGVDEPSRCTYEMKFQTPAVCRGEDAEALLAEFDDGEETDKQEL
eukprot:GFKZ01004271.1.p1 GENE.GFKZ01004271.1~~GFKZ01004271.1.p1  ORF type:complete len:641 (-),score=129.81 GFKZ01004271.1:481-2208(-)